MNNNYFNNAKVILKNIYEQKIKKNSLLKNELSFWSSFVNKKYSLIIKNYTKRDMEKLRKEIELIAEFELEDCGKIYMIRKNL